jgi:cell division protein FtsB
MVTMNGATSHRPGSDLRPIPPSVRTVRLRLAVVSAVIAALLLSALSALTTAVVMRGDVTDRDTRVAALTEQVTDLTARVDAVTADNSALEDQNAALSGQLDGARTQIADLTKRNTELKAQVEGLTPTEPVFARLRYDAVLGESKWFEPEGSGAFLLIIDVRVHNPDAERPAYFSPYDVRVKGPDDAVYPLLEASPVASQPRFVSGVSDLPGGRIQLSGQELAPSETVTGSLVFYVPKRVDTFSVSYRGQTTQLAL